MALASIVIFGCTEPGITMNPDDQLNYGVDTLMFDTIFSTFGSTTKYFTVINPHNKSVEISTIQLEGGASSKYRMNVDGIAGSTATDVLILPNDSLYVFVEVTVDPNDEDLPFIVEDSIRFNVNGNVNHVKLLTFGQNAHFFDQDTLTTTTWNDDRPYVIFKYIVIDSLETLTINEGVNVHLHNGAAIVVKGNLNVFGTPDSTVTFSGTRLEYDYQDLPGQWNRIYLQRAATANFEYTEIRNSLLGLSVGSDLVLDLSEYGLENMPIVNLKNSKIKNTLGPSLLGVFSDIKADNCQFYNSETPVQFGYGGLYEMNHCNILGSGNDAAALFMGNFAIDVENEILYAAEIIANYNNCIINGSQEEELQFDYNQSTEDLFTYSFNNCLLKTDTLDDVNMVDCIYNEIPSFVALSAEDFQLDSTSILINKGIILPTITNDFINNLRDDGSPDIGAFEFKP